MSKVEQPSKRLDEVRNFIGDLYGQDLHAKRIDALAGASLAVSMIGQALARGLVTKHAVKQVDRLLSNAVIDVWDSFARRVPQQIGTARAPGGEGLDRVRP